MLHYSLPEPQKTCEDYGGIAHHTNPKTCCASECGAFCGAESCRDGPGGSAACCDGGIPADHTCGFSERMAPCHLGIKII